MKIFIQAPFNGPSGYSNMSRSYLKALIEYTDLEIGIDFFNYWGNIPGALTREEELLLNKLSRNRITGRHAAIIINVPDAFTLRSNAVCTIGICMFETNRIPLNWIPKCNMLDEVWNPTQWGRDIFKKGGVNNVRYMPPVAEYEIFKPGEPLSLMKSGRIQRKDGFTFLTNADWTPRKNIEGLLRAYFSEFKASEPVVLLLKVFHIDCSENRKRELKNKIIKIKNDLGLSRVPKVLIFGDILTKTELPKLYNSIDCYITPHRGEGIGLPPIEAGLCEKAVIATNATGVTDFLTEENSYLLPVQRWADVDPGMERITPNYKNMMWPLVTEKSIRKAMRKVFTEGGREKGVLLRKNLIEKYNPQKVAGLIEERIKYFLG